ncbi:MAG: SOS response-associated peptidase, partial [Tannerellaceae bacterium]|nr:SOS response-associated peptidase [Tannerellaceae bacterium]
ELVRRYGRKADIIEIAEEIISETYHINAFNYPRYPIITADQEIQLFNWGLIPYWVKSEEDAKSIRSKTLNARAETLFTKPSYKYSIRNKRCLIPVTGFFEWRHEGKQKIPYYIHLKDEKIFSMAGIYASWHDTETNSSILSFSQITTEANPLMAWVHNSKKRMPALIHREDEKIWLDPKLTQKEIEGLLQPFDENLMTAYPISPDFLRMNPKSKEIIKREG